MFQAVIFDWDGTLANTECVVVSSFQKVLSKINVRTSDEFIQRRIGIGAFKTFREILQSADFPFDDALIERLVKDKILNALEMSNQVTLFPGSIDLLVSLYGRIKLGLASMNNQKVVLHLLDIMNIDRYFDAILTINDISEPKPDPEIFLKCAQKLRADSEKCVVVEDSIFGIKAAKKAKMGCIAVPTGAYSKEELEKADPDLIVNSLEEKHEILEFIFQ